MTDYNWYGASNRVLIPVAVDTDPGADQVVPLFRAPVPCTVLSAYAFMTDAVAANGSNWIKLSLMNGGTAGTGTTSISGTAGGTAGWSALAAVAMTPTADAAQLETGEVVVLKYDENGTVAPGVPFVAELEVLMQRSEDDINEELDTVISAVTTAEAIFTAAKDASYYLADTQEFARSMENDLANIRLRLTGDLTEASIRWKNRAPGD